MQFSTIIATFVTLLTVASAGSVDKFDARDVTARASTANGNRGNAVGSCCFAARSLKEDFCTTETGVPGKCIPSGAKNCGGQLTCVASSTLTCSATAKENGRPVCR